ncbi:catalase [uncultured Nostoc sp.]|uniref:catalase n=1 Tax=uncultured Nostoc sp. TaxID=340711 RepID=UPI0035CADA7F
MGEFSVEDNIPELLKVGVFAQSKTYPVWVRFSSAAPVQKRGKLSSDLEPDARGMTIKLLQVQGETVLDIEQETQDFLLVNHPVFIVRDPQGFATLTKAGIGQATEEELRSLEPTFKILKAITSKQVTNPLLIQYWSMTPYQLGTQMIKFSVKPHASDTPGSTPTSENYLREAAVQYLSEDNNDAVFDFLVQLYVDDEKTPI